MARLAIGPRQRIGEEIPERKVAARRGDVLVGGRARHRALVQLGRGGDVAQHQRPQLLDAVLEEGQLPRDHRLGHPEHRPGALIERLDQPVGRLEALADILLVALVAAAARKLGVVGGVDQHLGQGRAVQLDAPAAARGRQHEDVGHHRLDDLLGERQAGLRVERLELGDHLRQVLAAARRRP